MRKQKEGKIDKLLDELKTSTQTTSLSPRQFYPRLVNFSDTQLMEDEQELLQKVLKFSLPSSNRKLGMNNLVADLERLG